MDFRFINPITVLSDIGGYSVDVTTGVVENYEHIITQNPIEDGSPTTDHITNLPPKISISGGFSDLRISKLAGPALTQDATKGLAKENFDKLLQLYAERKTFDLMNGFHLFKDCQFKSLRLRKDREGFSIFFDAEIWVIIKVLLDSAFDIEFSAADALNRKKMNVQLLQQVGTVSTENSLVSIGVLA